MAVKALSATYIGIIGQIITVEVDITSGLPNFKKVGYILPIYLKA